SWGGRAAAAPVALSGALLVLALAYLYAPLWQSCWKEWWREGSAYSHGILIPPLALLMVWYRRDELEPGDRPRAASRSSRCAGENTPRVRRPALTDLALVLLGLALQLFAHWACSTMLSWASFLMLITGGIVFVAGWAAAARLLPP